MLSIEILIIDDSVGDANLIVKLLSGDVHRSHLHIVNDGMEALGFLRRQGIYADAPQPDIIILDLNLPKKSGHEILADIKADPRLCTIPVIVLTTSEAETDIQTSYRLGANAYLVKPLDLEEFIAIMDNFRQFWLHHVKLP